MRGKNKASLPLESSGANEPSRKSPASPSQTSRRRFLRTSGLLLGAAGAVSTKAALGQTLPAASPPAIPESMKAPGTTIGGARLYGSPSPFERKIIRNVPAAKVYNSTQVTRTPIQELDGIITPSGLFYERHHGGVPDIDPATHRLMLHGLVRTPLLFTVDDLRRFPSVSKIHFLECSGNPIYRKPYGKTASDLVGLVSCGEWTGVPLKTLLDEAGLEPSGKWVVAEGADAAAMTRSIPIGKCLDDALVVYSQNGERLRPEQGYPLRLFLPGFEGNMSVKWLRRLNVVDSPAHTREETSKYTDPMPDGKSRQFTFLMEAKSIITRPSGGQRIASPGFVEITGIAWSGLGKITKVEVSVDGGATWGEAALQDPVLSKSLTRFRFPWKWEGQAAVIQSRATDESGYVQPTFPELLAVRGENAFYHNNSVQPWRIAANGEVTNANN